LAELDWAAADVPIVEKFKGYTQEEQAQIEIKNYHAASHDLEVIPFLVLTKATNRNSTYDEVILVSEDGLANALEPYIIKPFNQCKVWFESEYAPTPSLLQSAQLLFKEKKFPAIKRAHSAGIPYTLNKLFAIAQEAEATQTHHLALITGVPGAGKTLVGLQFVFETIEQDLRQKAVFLSGNTPLVKVLQASLNNTHFVKGVHDFLKTYAPNNALSPSENIAIYDEAQRAWDSEKVARSNRTGFASEPTDFVNIANRKSHFLLIGLIGEGQEIYDGEESGMVLWQEAIQSSPTNWKIHCPEKLTPYFQGNNLEVVPNFNLTTSLRTHQALTLQQWVEFLLNNQLDEARLLAAQLHQDNYPIYLTRDLAKAKAYLTTKYQDEPPKTFGIMASSKSILLPQFGVKNDYNSSKAFQIADYYVYHQSPYYCRKLTGVVSEFGCQGLELDMPLLAWEGDFIYDNGWKTKVNHERRSRCPPT
jgi:hypothetical protein